ncbi:E3 ubiquitin-protein ligase RNF4-like [Argopecten irradians]|uniref:E3 ubiquitin-protein ligase RNF4-like n=1 Tax=Argopecten irradians TaxID=31199 RepID=UPI0037238CED
MSTRIRDDRSRARRRQRREMSAGRRPLRSRIVLNNTENTNDVEIISSQPNRSCIDLTSDTGNDFIDLTSPIATNAPSHHNTTDESVLFVGEESVLDLSGDLLVEEDDEVAEAVENLFTPDLDDSIASLPGNRKVTCPVCLDSDERITRSGRQLNSTTCGHIFCNECIEGAIRSQKRCPTCRKTLSRRQIHPIFL